MSSYSCKKPHDHFVKQAMSNPNVARDFLEEYLPEELKSLVDLTTLRPMKDHFANQELGAGIMDLLYSVTLRNKEKGYVSILVEHQTKQERFMPLRFMKYMLGICHMHMSAYPKSKYLPLIYPILYYTGKKPYVKSLAFWDLFHDPEKAKRYFTEPVQLIDINQIEDEDVRNYTLGGLMSYVMRHRVDRDILTSLLPLRNLLKVVGKENPLYLVDIIWYLVEVSDTLKPKKVLQFFDDITADEQKEHVMTIAERLYQQGFDVGIEKGKCEGERETVARFFEAMQMAKSGVSLMAIVEKTKLNPDSVEQLLLNIQTQDKEVVY